MAERAAQIRGQGKRARPAPAAGGGVLARPVPLALARPAAGPGGPPGISRHSRRPSIRRRADYSASGPGSPPQRAFRRFRRKAMAEHAPSIRPPAPRPACRRLAGVVGDPVLAVRTHCAAGLTPTGGLSKPCVRRPCSAAGPSPFVFTRDMPAIARRPMPEGSAPPRRRRSPRGRAARQQPWPVR